MTDSRLDLDSHLADAEIIEFLFETILGRPIGNDGFKEGSSGLESIGYWIRTLLDSQEFRIKFLRHHANRDQIGLPISPAVLGEPQNGTRLHLLGTCQVGFLTSEAPERGWTAQHQLTPFRRYEPPPVLPPEGADGVIAAFTLRHVLMDAIGAPMLPIADMAFARLNDAQAAQTLIERCAALIDELLSNLAQNIKGAPVFMLSFSEPSFNYMGSLINPYEPTSPRAVIRRLNEMMCNTISGIENFYFIDINDIMNSIGRMHFHDDIVLSSSHGSYISAELYDKERLAPSRPNSVTYRGADYLRLYSEVLLRQIGTCLETIRASRPVKLIVVDLDDTLWRGVAAEGELPPWEHVEGWPLGFVEALLFFKKRGGLLAIASKNDREPTLERLKAIYGGAITAEDFAAIKINWTPKSENIAEILQETNILPQNVLFIDDNPREIDEVRARFPQMRFLNENHYDWRRVILQAPETQVVRITEESKRRTEMVKARVERLELEKTMSRDEWLTSLQIEQALRVLNVEDKPRFERAFELINKTNQFNTTGKRWELSEFKNFLSTGGVCLLASLKDKTTDNGIIGVSLIEGGEIVQAVLSCRVFGLGAEVAMGAKATKIALSQAPVAIGRIIDTGKNFTCHDWFAKLGFEQVGSHFETAILPETPGWIRLSEA